MFCRNCGKEISSDAIACPSCGVAPNNGKKFCQNCGAEANELAVICVKCGVKLSGQNQSSEIPGIGGKKQVNWLLCLLMSIFLGYFAVDRFIMGHVGLGILKIVTCGGCGVWWLVDLILIATRYKFADIEWVDE